MAMSPDTLRVKITNKEYNENDIRSMRVNFLNTSRYDLVDVINDLCNLDGTLKKGVNKIMSLPKIAQKVIREPVGEIREQVELDITIAEKFLQLKDSASKRGLEFNLTLSEVRNLLKRKKCYYTGLLFDNKEGLIRTIDRIDSKKGYISGNVVACCSKVNALKDHVLENETSKLRLTVKELKKFVTTLEKLGVK